MTALPASTSAHRPAAYPGAFRRLLLDMNSCGIELQAGIARLKAAIIARRVPRLTPGVNAGNASTRSRQVGPSPVLHPLLLDVRGCGKARKLLPKSHSAGVGAAAAATAKIRLFSRFASHPV